MDELEEATSKLQKAEDELLDLQDKVIQAEGSNSSLLSDVETLRKRVLKIEGKDEEIRKAEDLCRSVREKLEEEEQLTKGLRVEIERLQVGSMTIVLGHSCDSLLESSDINYC